MSPEENLRKFREDLKQSPGSMLNRLFFSARNGAITACLRQIEHHFQDHGFFVKAQWSETSMRGPSINIVLFDKKTGEHHRSISVNREVFSSGYQETHSDCVYTLKEIHVGDYYPRKKPKIAVDFDDCLAAEEFKNKVEGLILGTNYPFACGHYSSF